MTRRQRQKEITDPNTLAFQEAWRALSGHPLFLAMTQHDWQRPHATAEIVARPLPALCRVTVDGRITVSRHRKLDRDEWRWVLAHALLHLGFGHLEPEGGPDPAYLAAACLAVTRFQRAVKLGREPDPLPDLLPAAEEDELAARWRRQGVPAELAAAPDLDLTPVRFRAGQEPAWPDRFALGLSAAAVAGVEVAGGARESVDGKTPPRQPWDLAMSWFIGSYPLLGGLAAGFTLVADGPLARSWEIAIAAVSAEAGEIYVNPWRSLSEDEWRFVLAHEMLHVALRHADRGGARDPYLWNVACDYVINGWLVEMGVGTLPDGTLYDPELAGSSAEQVYDRIAGDLRRMRKLSTLRGQGAGDMLGEPLPWSGRRGGGMDLDEYCRRALLTGYAYHQSSGRGLLPSGLVAEIRVLEQPPLPWDVRLARWFDEHVPMTEPVRSYARPSRRQSATPDIPRPGRYRPEEAVPRSTFGVVVDTSGSMNHELMGKALGAIVSYATARDVPAARVVFCDAAPYDAGYLPVSDIAGRVRVRGRGGTILQPAIDLLERAEDFPPSGPILVITDGWIDVLRIRRAHAFLMPRGARLPFTPRGEVFSLR
ncbi:vWA domain-containing protein [Actinoplanes sp. G11-F43]|uniref:vWA domain-containing protein n=1 Tax=Actinoplanes sp. G11-F43 TaxID=3424130 RepID=UPI003D34D95A